MPLARPSLGPPFPAKSRTHGKALARAIVLHSFGGGQGFIPSHSKPANEGFAIAFDHLSMMVLFRIHLVFSQRHIMDARL